MFTNYFSELDQNNVPQTEPISDNQVQNRAGGYVFSVGDEAQLRRFIVLGSSNTYYAGSQEMTSENVENIVGLIQRDGEAFVNLIADAIAKNVAPKYSTIVLSLAAAFVYGDKQTHSALYKLIRTGDAFRIPTHLYEFYHYVKMLRGGINNGKSVSSLPSGLRRAIVAGYYLNPKIDARSVAMHVLKYQQRSFGIKKDRNNHVTKSHSVSHRDMLRLLHPKTNDVARNTVFNFAVNGTANLPILTGNIRPSESLDSMNADYLTVVDYLWAHEQLAKQNVSGAVALINEFGFTHEMLPSQLFSGDQDDVQKLWRAILGIDSKWRMPLGALLRNLGRIGSSGLFETFKTNKINAGVVDYMLERLTGANFEREVKNARIHPIAVLNAYRVYAQGKGVRGNKTWAVNKQVSNALETAFYRSFDAVVPSKKRLLLALDISGSMSSGTVMGLEGLTPREVTAVMAMTAIKVEPSYKLIGFTASGYNYYTRSTNVDSAVTEIDKITANTTIEDAMSILEALPTGQTDVATPLLWAQKHNMSFDGLVVYTDNETYAGSTHPNVALLNYRKSSGIDTRVVAVATTATSYGVLDPDDSLSVEVCGFDASSPAFISDFIGGRI